MRYSLFIWLAFIVLLAGCSGPAGVKEAHILVDETHWKNLPDSCIDISRMGEYHEITWHLDRKGTFECRINSMLIDDAKESYNTWASYDGYELHKTLIFVNPFEYNPVKICCRQSSEQEQVCADSEIVILCLPKDRDLSNVG